MQKEIKAIIFDAARVLMNFDTNIFVKAIKPYSPYSEEEILAKLILTNLYVPFAMDDNEKYALHPNKHPLVHHILKWLVLYIENK